jgi:V/A-type H+-transporting ATPase subunit K
MMNDFLRLVFVENVIALPVAGGMLALMFGGWGSARGLRAAGAQTAGVLAQKPELFGKVFVLTILPATQGIYGFVSMILIAVRAGVIGQPETLPDVAQGLMLFALGLTAGVVYYFSARFQGETCAACISLTARRPEEFGRSLLFPILVEFYALLAFLGVVMLFQG